MFGLVGLENISGDDFFEVLRSLVSVYLPDGRRIAEIMSDYAVLFLLLGIVVGISQCFFGYKLRKVWTGILMAILCGCGGAVLATEFGLSVAALIGITALATIIGGLAGYFLWIIGCFLRPFAIGSIAVFSGFVIYQLQTLGLIVGLAAGLIAGILVAAFYKIGLRLYTAVFGGLLVGGSVWELTGLSPWYPAFIIGGILALIGFGVQLFIGRKPKEGADSGEEATTDGTIKQEGMAVFFAEGRTEGGTMNPQSMEEVAATAEPDAAIAMPEGLAASGQLPFAPSDGTDGNTNGNGTISSPAGDQNAAAHSTLGNNADIAAGICPSCGTPYSARAKFCMQCGCKLQI